MRTVLMGEKSALALSAAVAGLFAIGGILWGLLADSMMILFDGAYSLISLALSGLALFTAHQLQKPANPSFPFGYAPLQPLTIAIKGVTLALLCLLSLGAAIASLTAGGRETEIGMALVFAAISTLVCFALWAYLQALLRRQPSDLLRAEAQQWLMDTVLSGAVLVGFAVTAAIEHTAWARFAVYGDPLLVVIVSGYFLSVPARMTLQALRELLWAAPERALQHRVTEALAATGLPAEDIRMTKIGPYLVIDLDIPAPEAARGARLRFQLYRQLAGLPVRPVVFLNPESVRP